MIEAPKEAFPLTWPVTQRRTPPGRHRAAHFKVTFLQARTGLLDELRRLGARNIVVSSNAPIKRDGLPSADSDPGDPGCAVYFEREGKHYVLAIDCYVSLRSNVQALRHTVEAYRTIGRHGSDLLEQAMGGFLALPPAHALDPPWWEVFGVEAHESTEKVREARAALVEKHHPDRGGDHDKMAQINRAWDAFCKERGL